MTAIKTPLGDGLDVAEDIGGKAHNRAIIMDTAGADAIGLVATAPAANTLLGRLKAIADAIAAMVTSLTNAIGVTASADSFFAITPGAAALSTVPKAIYVTTGGTLIVKGADGGGATFTVPDQSIIAIRPRYVTGGTATGIIGLI